MSFGENESCMEPGHSLGAARRIRVRDAQGHHAVRLVGGPGCGTEYLRRQTRGSRRCPRRPADPLVTGVGGTELAGGLCLTALG